MAKKVVQLISGAKIEHDANHVYITITDPGVIFVKKDEGSKLWKVIHMSQVYYHNHTLSIVTTPQSSVRFDRKEEL